MLTLQFFKYILPGQKSMQLVYNFQVVFSPMSCRYCSSHFQICQYKP